ncbi:MAG: ABC transporter permease [Chloroflexota bacterium]|nr:ABC transporter permease [Chloroflexota bacterium]
MAASQGAPAQSLLLRAEAEMTGDRRWQSLHRLLRHRGAVIGFVLLLVMIVAALTAPLLTGYDPIQINPPVRNQAPSGEHWFGTDQFGRDIFTRVVYGARISLPVGFIAVGIAAVVGLALGLVAGYYGKLLDAGIMRVIDVMLAFPGILLALVVVAILGPSLVNVMIAVGISEIPRYTRLVRGSVLSAKENLYVDAARVTGVKDLAILARHILPNVIGPIVVLATLSLGTAILAAAGLSFLGLGAQPPNPEWGAMLADGRQSLGSQWWISTMPGLAIAITVLAVNMAGDGLRDVLDPRLRV